MFFATINRLNDLKLPSNFVDMPLSDTEYDGGSDHIWDWILIGAGIGIAVCGVCALSYGVKWCRIGASAKKITESQAVQRVAGAIEGLANSFGVKLNRPETMVKAVTCVKVKTACSLVGGGLGIIGGSACIGVGVYLLCSD